MTFRVKIISPIKVDEADLRRRQIRYTEHAGQDTQELYRQAADRGIIDITNI